MSSELELEELSPEIEMAMQTAISILGGDDERHSVRETGPTEEVAIAEPEDVKATTLEPQPQTELRHISDRNAIPITEKHVLVMWGLSTYRFEHPGGVTFAVDNSRSNADRDRQYREALVAATELARSEGLQYVYVLD